MTTTDLLSEYKNGNYSVKIFSDGTKIREGSSSMKASFPEAFDLKITDFCDLSSLCLFCHENSTKDGKHGDLFSFFSKLKDLPAGVEIAIGGGNPLSHPDLEQFLLLCKMQGLICNLTVNQKHLNKEFMPQLLRFQEKDLIKGLGISLRLSKDKDHFDPRRAPAEKLYDLSEIKKLKNENVVLHLISGIDKPDLLDHLPDATKILVLGYKKFRNGGSFFNEKDKLASWRTNGESISSLIKEMSQKIRKHFGRLTVSFDNLAIQQLDIKRFFTKPEAFERIFMGDDGRFTFYVDLPNQEFAVSSTSTERKKMKGLSVPEMFKEIQQ